MPRSLSNEDLAKRLIDPQVDHTVLKEASRRLSEIDLRHVMSLVDVAAAISASPQFDDKASDQIEQVVMSVALSNRSLGRISSLAGRILSGAEYTRDDVLSIAASVLSRDDDDKARNDR